MVSFKMLGRDINASPIQYRTWVVANQPDYTGQFYTGDKSGPEPLVDITAYAIFNPNEVVDFNLPDPLNWNVTYDVLPGNVCDAQLAIIDGYIYLFGGQNSKKIYQASVDNPATWVDTGATLPTVLAGSQLAIIDGYVYLFGGTTDPMLASDTANIYSAPVSNPLNWTNNGPLLPSTLQHSQLAIVDGYAYLYGGFSNSQASNVIYQAPLSNPLVWTNTGATLPAPLYGSQLGVVDGYIYLFGGILSGNIPTQNIYGAFISQPLVWNTLPFFLPYPSYYGQFATVGAQGYLFTPTASATSYTKILVSNLSAPYYWVDSQSTVAGTASQSQLAIVYDRLFLFGGNGSTIILANEPIYKYNFTGPSATSYGNITRTQANMAPSETALFQTLGFAPWKTDYGSFNF